MTAPTALTDRWDPSVFDAPPFQPFAPYLDRLRHLPDWPTLPQLEATWLAGLHTADGAPLRLLPHQPRPRRRRRAPARREDLYDFRVTRGLIPTRARCWHDLFNVLSFACFPLAKQVLHGHHRRILTERLPDPVDRLPPGRTAFQDLLTMTDEGGALLLAQGPTLHALHQAVLQPEPSPVRALLQRPDASVRLFGHAHLEQLAQAATGAPWPVEPRARPVVLDLPPDAPLPALDRALAAWLASPAAAERGNFAVPLLTLLS